MAETPDARTLYTPSRLNGEARGLLEGHFGVIWIEGEVSNLRQPASGHQYFSLKDDAAQISCALFRQYRMRSPVQLRDGLQVQLRGRVGLYEARGDFQIVADYVEEAGEGRLRAQFEALKAKLEAEGLFDTARKRPLPRFPRHLAIITSPGGAAIRDVLSVLERRFPCLQVSVLASSVQGAEAPPQLLRALRQAEALAPDVLLITRGGGSMEDLWAFNDETLARAVADSPLVTVSAIGHEVDFTLLDFVADLRAPTPSAAAELLVPQRDDLVQTLDHQQTRLGRALRRRIDLHQATVRHLGRQLRAHSPAARLVHGRERLGRLAGRLERAARRGALQPRQRLDYLLVRLRTLNPAARIGQLRAALAARPQQLGKLVERARRQRSERLASLRRALEAISPDAVLARGYSVTFREDGRILRDSAAVAEGDRLQTRLARGAVLSQVTGRAAASPADREAEDNGGDSAEPK